MGKLWPYLVCTFIAVAFTTGFGLMTAKDAARARADRAEASKLRTAAKEQRDNQKWILVHIETVNGMPMPVDKAVVDHVAHEADGSICYRNVAEDKRYCLKASYLMREAE